MKHKRKIRSGFTLIELMVVIVIIGILAALAVVAYRSAMRKTRDTTRISHMKDIAIAQEQEKSLDGSYVVGANATSCPSVIGENDFPTPPNVSEVYTCRITADAFCVAAQLEGENSGNCGGCSGAGVQIEGATTHFCVVDRQ